MESDQQVQDCELRGQRGVRPGGARAPLVRPFKDRRHQAHKRRVQMGARIR